MTKCEYCQTDVSEADFDSHISGHIIDFRDIGLATSIDGLIHKDVYFDTAKWEADGFVKKLEIMSKEIDEIFKKAIDDKTPIEVIFYLIYNYKIAYARILATSEQKIKVAVSKE